MNKELREQIIERLEIMRGHRQNEYLFLKEFKNACEDQASEIGEEMTGVNSVISIRGEKLPVVYDIEIDEDGILETTNWEIDFGL